MQAEMSATPYFPDWRPKELGLPRATGIAVVLVVIIVAFLAWVFTTMAPKAPPQVIQITQAQTMQLPAPTPPPPPKVIPPPKPLPVVIPKPPPVESKIVVPVKQPPPRPVVHRVVHPAIHPPQKQVAQPVAKPVVAPEAPVKPAAPAAAPAAVAHIDGGPIYGAHMREILQANQDVPPALASLGISGTAMVRILVAPDGHVISATLVTSSGNSLIDQTALAHAKEASFGAFNANMPNSTQSFVVPVNIAPSDDQ